MAERGKDIRIVRLAPGEDRGAWRDALVHFNPAAAIVLKEDVAAAVYRATLCGREVAMKRWDLQTSAKRSKTRLGLGRGDRHWRGATWLQAHGIRTAKPLVLATERGAPRRQWLIMEWLPGKSVLAHLADADLSVREEHALAWACGELIARLFGANRFNRDGKPSNLIVTRSGPKPEIAVIDSVAIQRIVAAGEKLPRMVASLFIEPSGCGYPPRRALAMAAVHGVWCDLRGQLPPHHIKRLTHGLWRDAARIVASHGNPRPAIDPLAPPRQGHLTAQAPRRGR